MEQLIGRKCLASQSVGCRAISWKTDYILNKMTNQLGLSFLASSDKSVSDCNMWQRVKLIVIFRWLGELLRDDVLTDVDEVVLQSVTDIRQIVVQGHLDLILWFA